MAQKAEQHSAFVCSVCLDLLKDPVTLNCGHNYCLKCVQQHWDKEEDKQLYTCPECRVSFTPRPVLKKNLLLASVVEQMRTAPPADPVDPADLYAGPQDVSCDVCSGRKLRAVQSCLQCVVSYCERHLQPHYDVAAFHKHQLVAPSHTLQENICYEHNELKKMFCRTDSQLLCLVCCLEKHRDHETVSAASERAQREAQLGDQRDLLLQDVQDKDTEMSILLQQEQDIRTSAHTALHLSRDSFKDMILFLETRAKEVEQQIQTEEERGLSRVREIQDQVKQELRELKKSLSDLDTLSLTKDHNAFLQLHTALPTHSQRPVPVRVHLKTKDYFEAVTRSVSELKDRLHLTVEEEFTNISLALSRVRLSLTEPRSREDFVQYSTDFTLDTNTAHPFMLMSDGNRSATIFKGFVKVYDHQDRFSDLYQALSSESVTGRCYWEVEWCGERGVHIAVSYRDIQRRGDTDECKLGYNTKSWALFCHKATPSFMFNSVKAQVSGPVGSRIGVYLDHSAGVLCFYSVSENMRLIHREETTFTQPLHAGVRIIQTKNGSTVHFPKLK